MIELGNEFYSTISFLTYKVVGFKEDRVLLKSDDGVTVETKKSTLLEDSIYRKIPALSSQFAVA